MRMSRNLQDGGPGFQNRGGPSQYRTNFTPPSGFRTRNLQAGGPGYQGPSLQQQREQDRQRRIQEQEFQRRTQEEAEARYRQQQREEREYRERIEADERRRREEMIRRRGAPRSKNLHTGPAYIESMREQELTRQYREAKKRRGGGGWFW